MTRSEIGAGVLPERMLPKLAILPTLAALRSGRHVYCEKPLAHTVHEVRALMAAARKHGVVTQLGNQGHSFDTIRKTCEWRQTPKFSRRL